MVQREREEIGAMGVVEEAAGEGDSRRAGKEKRTREEEQKGDGGGGEQGEEKREEGFRDAPYPPHRSRIDVDSSGRKLHAVTKRGSRTCG